MAVEPFPQWEFGGGRLEFAHQARVVAQLQFDVETPFQRRQPFLVQDRHFRTLDHAGRNVGERSAPPLRQCLAEQPGLACDVGLAAGPLDQGGREYSTGRVTGRPVAGLPDVNPIELIDSILDCENRTRRTIRIILASTLAVAVVLLTAAFVAIGIGHASSSWVIPTAFSGLVAATAARIRHSRRTTPDDATSPRRTVGHRSG